MKAVSVLLTVIIASSAWGKDLVLTAEQQNIVSGSLLGSWVLDKAMTKTLLGRTVDGERTLDVEAAPDILKQVPTKFRDFAQTKNLTIYLAGYLTLDGKLKAPFVLTSFHGNPYVFFWLERGGDPFGNSESFNVMLVKAKEQAHDRLYIGGDFSNEPFRAFTRKIK